MKIKVIVDGNNVAFVKFPGIQSRITPEYDDRLVSSFSCWVKVQKIPCEVELFLDPRREIPVGTESVRVYIAEHQKKADHSIIDKAHYYSDINVPFLAVTNDNEMQDEFRKLGGEYISAFDFVQRRSGIEEYLSLDLIINESKLTTWKEKISSLCHQPSVTEIAPIRSAINKVNEIQKKKSWEDLEWIYQNTLEHQKKRAGLADSAEMEEHSTSDFDLVIKKKIVKLTPENWPIEDGVKFLFNSMCLKHRQEFESWGLDKKTAAVDDLKILFEFFISFCREEEDVVERGCSAMDRVRLILLKNYPDVMEYELLLKLCNGAPGTAGKINKYNGKWLALLEI